jgi:hypothetical protein
MDGRQLVGRFNRMIRQSDETRRISLACDLLRDIFHGHAYAFLCISMKYRFVVNYIAAIIGIIRPDPVPVKLSCEDREIVRVQLSGLFK